MLLTLKAIYSQTIDSTLFFNDITFERTEDSTAEDEISDDTWLDDTRVNESVFPPSPTASSLGKYGDCPVSYYTGQPIINIPIYNIKARDMEIPIYLNYETGGVKVDEVASWVGMNWNLFAGGLITRNVKVFPDERSGTGYFDNSGFVNDPQSASVSNFEKAARGELDTEPDIFYYNFNGKSGKFVFDTYKNIYSIPYNNLRISSDIYNNAITGFRITDENGIQYFFGQGTNTIEVSKYIVYSYSDKLWYTYFTKYIPFGPPYPTNGICSNEGFYLPSNEGILDTVLPILKIDNSAHIEKSYECNTTWFLNEIVTPNHDVITFNYDCEGRLFSRTGIQEEANDEIIHGIRDNFLYKYKFQNGKYPEYGVTKYYTGEITRPNNLPGDCQRTILYTHHEYSNIRLAEINYGSLIVKFTSNHPREDIQIKDFNGTPKALSKIQVIDNTFNNNKIIKEFNFSYSTKQTDDVKTAVDPKHSNIYTYRDAEQKRLFLDQVQELSYKEDNTIIYNNPYILSYWDGQLPRRCSSSQDEAGYYSFSNASNYKVTSIYDYGKLGDTYIFIGPHITARTIEKARVGSLKKITYPTGGSTAFTYVFNEYSLSGENKSSYGLRIANIENDFGENVKETKTFAYNNDDNKSSGYIEGSTVYGYNMHFQFNSEGSHLTNRKYASFNSFRELELSQGTRIHYGKISELIDGAGKKEYYYYDQNDGADYTDVFTATQDYDNNGSNISNHQYPFPPESSHSYRRGLLKKIVDKDNNNRLLKKTEYFYTFSTEHNHKIYGVKCGMHQLGSEKHHTYGRYYYTSQWVYLEKTIETVYNSNLVNGSLVIETDYEYNPGHLQIIKKTQTQSDGSVLTTKYQYPEDYTDLDVYCNAEYEKCISTCNELSGDERARCIDNCEQKQQNCSSNNINNVYIHGIYDLVSKHIYTSIIEEYTTLKRNSVEETISGQLNLYKTFSINNKNVVLPYRNLSLDLDAGLTNFSKSNINTDTELFEYDSKYQEKNRFEMYDEYGNVLQCCKTNNVVNSYLWGYNYTNPIAEIIGISYPDVLSVLTSCNYTIEGLQNMTNDELLVALECLRTHLPNAMVTYYTYKPFVGMETKTDPNGIRTFYEYDSFGRLSAEKDNNQFILKKYEYHYVNQQ